MHLSTTEPSVLTKFINLHSNTFQLEKSSEVKISLPSEFNNIFDSQISMTPNNI